VPASGDVHLARLRLFNFRNYAELNLELGAGLNVFVGENAQGKTNLLEGVATLLLTRSPRTSTPAELLRWGADEAAVDAVLERRTLTESLALRLRRVRDAGPDQEGATTLPRVSRTTSRDGHPIAPRDLLGRWPVVLFWPDDLQLVKAGPEARRRLLDVLLAQLDRSAADELVRYRRVLEQRNSLLRRLHATGDDAPDQLHPFDEALVEHGAGVQVARAGLVGELAPLAATAIAEISDGGDELELRYAPHYGGTGRDRAEVMAALRRALAGARAEELARGTTVVGPHRDDLDYVLNGRPARSTASQGQQRSAVLATKLAEVRLVAARTGRLPVLLLDDVLSELDPTRRERLLWALSSPGGAPQTLVTCSEESQFGGRRAQGFLVRQGTVTAR
jgi:DNA replication and repair protein RecF